MCCGITPLEIKIVDIFHAQELLVVEQRKAAVCAEQFTREKEHRERNQCKKNCYISYTLLYYCISIESFAEQTLYIEENKCLYAYLLGETNKMKDNTVSVVFVSLLLDLLAFTMILPLLPALLDHYKEIENGQGLYSAILSRVKSIQIFFDAPDKVSTVLFGGL